MSRPLDQLTCEQINNILRNAGYSWDDLVQYVANNSAALPASAPPVLKSDFDSVWVKSAAEAILQSKARLTPNAQTFVAQTFARASQYDTVKFSPKQWEWFNKIMLSAGVEALTLEGNNG